MKPINTKERSKLFWQFFFIVFALCFLPIGIIFCAYYETPVEISREQQEKLNNYSEFEHSQKILVKQLADIDSNIVVLNNGSNVNVPVAEATITKAIANLTVDSSRLIRTIGKTYTDYFTTADNLLKCGIENKKVNADLLKAQADLKEYASDKKTRDMIDAATRH